VLCGTRQRNNIKKIRILAKCALIENIDSHLRLFDPARKQDGATRNRDFFEDDKISLFSNMTS